ncbi:ribokinase-like isoform X2 [Daktulosphaira vitifoliae]|uniref:ribokinase-like isoform X2 n=1 Tax=Daktulosphaira vitifoliae TaxID=58002 RepID=UPI0021AB08A3|nr:ribokinase-like isoform X2 [Daktulosphaira vitifoliae]
MSKIVVVGSCGTDLFFYTSKLPTPGQTIHGKQFSVDFGGKGANQCVAAQKLGADTVFIGCVGTDIFGNDIIDNFKNIGVDTTYIIKKANVDTGVAQINVTDDGENYIIIVAGANGTLLPADIDKAETLFHSEIGVVIFQFETPLETTEYLLNKLSKINNRCCKIVNGAPAYSNLHNKIFQLADIFCVNESEAEIYTNEIIKINSIETANQALFLLLKQGCNTVIITLGSLGAVFASKNNSEPQWVHSPKVTNPIDTTASSTRCWRCLYRSFSIFYCP